MAEGREWLGLEEVLRIRVPDPQRGVDLHHLGVLWEVDAGRTGRVTLADCTAFLALCHAVSQGHPSHEFRERLQGRCMLRLAGEMERAGGGAVVEWLCRLAWEARPEERLERPAAGAAPPPGRDDGPRGWRWWQRAPKPAGTGGPAARTERYVPRGAVEALHRVLGVEESQGIGAKAWADLLQAAGEEDGDLDLADPSLDDYVAMTTLRRVLAHACLGVSSMWRLTLGMDGPGS